MVNDWKPRLTSQLNRLKSSSLYDECNELHLVVTDVDDNKKNEIDELLIDFPKVILDYTTRNWYEGHALAKVDSLARNNPNSKLLYFHTKGVSNQYKNLINNEYYDLKVNSILCWADLMEFFLVDNWVKCVELLDEYDTVGVNNKAHWWWGNFWWSTSKHIENNRPFGEVFGGSRWQCEAWLHEDNNDRDNIKFFEWFPYMYDPYYSVIPSYFYNGTDLSEMKIEVIDAKFGYFAEQRDEGRGIEVLEDMTTDVTEKVIELISENNYKLFNFYPEQCFSGEDICPGLPKAIRIKFKTNIDSEKEYILTSYYCNKIEYGKTNEI